MLLPIVKKFNQSDEKYLVKLPNQTSLTLFLAWLVLSIARGDSLLP
jgi:hypothetical protein